MGDIVRPDRAIFLEILLEILKQVEEDWQEARAQGQANSGPRRDVSHCGLCFGLARGGNVSYRVTGNKEALGAIHQPFNTTSGN